MDTRWRSCHVVLLTVAIVICNSQRVPQPQLLRLHQNPQQAQNLNSFRQQNIPFNTGGAPLRSRTDQFGRPSSRFATETSLSQSNNDKQRVLFDFNRSEQTRSQQSLIPSSFLAQSQARSPFLPQQSQTFQIPTTPSLVQALPRQTFQRIQIPTQSQLVTQSLQQSKLQNLQTFQDFQQSRFQNPQPSQSLQQSKLQNHQTSQDFQQSRFQNPQPSQSLQQSKLQNNQTSQDFQQSRLQNPQPSQSLQQSKLQNLQTSQDFQQSRFKNPQPSQRFNQQTQPQFAVQLGDEDFKPQQDQLFTKVAQTPQPQVRFQAAQTQREFSSSPLRPKPVQRLPQQQQLRFQGAQQQTQSAFTSVPQLPEPPPQPPKQQQTRFQLISQTQNQFSPLTKPSQSSQLQQFPQQNVRSQEQLEQPPKEIISLRQPSQVQKQFRFQSQPQTELSSLPPLPELTPLPKPLQRLPQQQEQPRFQGAQQEFPVQSPKVQQQPRFQQAPQNTQQEFPLVAQPSQSQQQQLRFLEVGQILDQEFSALPQPSQVQRKRFQGNLNAPVFPTISQPEQFRGEQQQQKEFRPTQQVPTQPTTSRRFHIVRPKQKSFQAPQQSSPQPQQTRQVLTTTEQPKQIFKVIVPSQRSQNDEDLQSQRVIRPRPFGSRKVGFQQQTLERPRINQQTQQVQQADEENEAVQIKQRFQLQRQQQPQAEVRNREPVRPSLKTTTPEREEQTSEEKEDEFNEQAENAMYSFSSSVKDSINDNQVSRQETRDGKKVSGSYSYSDGFVKRIVHYEADENGYRVVKDSSEPIGEGPIEDIDGTVEVASNFGGNNHAYSITADDVPLLAKLRDEP